MALTFTEEEGQEAPIITYLNRLQKQMFLITAMLSDNQVSRNAIASPIRMLIYNLPETGQKALKEETSQLISFEDNIDSIPSKVKMEQIYQKVHDWAYKNLFQDVFKIRPRIKGKGHF